MSLIDYIEEARGQALEAKAEMDEHWDVDGQEHYNALRSVYRGLVCDLIHHQIERASAQFIDEANELQDSWELVASLSRFMSTRGLQTAVDPRFIDGLKIVMPVSKLSEGYANQATVMIGDISGLLGKDGVALFDDDFAKESTTVPEKAEEYKRPLVANGPIGTGSTLYSR
jgi:hypothetical protein